MSPTVKSPFAELIKRARNGDAKAWEELFSLCGDMEGEGANFLAMARRVLPKGDRARDFLESRDLLQTALRAGWIDCAEFQGNSPGEFIAWLRKIMQRKLLRVIEKKECGSLKRLDDEDDVQVKRDPHLVPLENMVREEVRERVRSAIKQLPEDQRVVMDLRLQGLKAPEIARLLSLSPEAVRKRESRAAARLRELLE